MRTQRLSYARHQAAQCVLNTFCRRVMLLSLAVLAFSQTESRAQVACTPDAGYTTCQAYTFTGADQGFTVPPGVSSIKVKAWGAGGGGSSAPGNNIGGPGGSGGFVEGVLAVTPGAQYVVVTGEGGGGDGMPGSSTDCAAAYGFGGACPPLRAGAYIDGGGGGGLSGLFTGSAAVTAASSARAVLVAGGGGGGEGTNTCGVGSAAGGAGGNSFAGTMPNMSGVTGAYNGFGGSAPTGGGGGYRGGAGTGRLSTNPACPLTGANGGSNFVAPGVTGLFNLAGTEAPSVPDFTAKNPPRTTEPQYVSGVGVGTATIGAPGGDGLVVVQWVDPAACNLAPNGSFESPAIPGQSYQTSVGTLNGWSITAGNVDLLRNYSNASDGFQSIDMYGTQAGTIQQTFSGLLPGATYTFSIDYSGLDPTQSSGRVELDNGGTQILTTLAPVAAWTANPSPPPTFLVTWRTYTYAFVASGTQATIRFVNTGLDTESGTGLFLDNFKFGSQLPCPPPLNTCTAEQTRATQRYWFFGQGGAIDFGVTGTTATPFLGNSANNGEGSTVITDNGGVLQFWSNGQTVFDRNGNAMQNGAGLLGAPSATQTVAAFPALGQPGKYFVVTNSTDVFTAGQGPNNQLYYSVVDMSLNGGLGAVTTKNVPLGFDNTASEALTAVPNADGTGFWVITYTNGSTNILAYEFNSTGPTGTVTTSTLPSANGTIVGTLNFSADLTQLVAMTVSGVSPYPGLIRLLQFNAVTGQISERMSWSAGASAGTVPYSAEFSPAGDYVYSSNLDNGGRLFRYRIAGATTGAQVKATEQDLGVASNGDAGANDAGQVKRGPDGRMYVADYGANTIGVINTPDGATPGYVVNGQPLAAGAISRYGLPQLVTGCPPPTATDYGDAPVTYGTPLHIATGPQIGAVRDIEPAAVPTPDATGDDASGTPDDEDGLQSATVTAGAMSASAVVSAMNPTTSPAVLAGWIDFNGNGVFDATERAEIAVPANTNAVTPFTLTWTGLTPVPLPTGTTSFARFRISTTAAEVTSPTGTANSGEVEDHTATVLAPVTDLAITKVSTPNPYVPGQSLIYTIVVSNLGPSVANGALVNDTLPATLSGITWTCTGNGGGSCPANGTGSLVNVPVNLPVGGSTTFTITATTPSGPIVTLTNTATVAPPSGTTDPVMGNNIAQDLNPAGPQADLRITKVSSPNPYVPGQALTYTMVVTNAGPSDAPGARVRDTWPAPFASFTWTCVPNGGGASCVTASGSGDIDALVNLPAGSSATFSGTGTVPSSLTGQVTNTATITEPATVTDPVQGNNAAQDVNPSDAQVDLAITKAQSPDPYVPGQSLTYAIVVTNNGPSDAPNARVQDTPPSSLTNVTWTCAASGAGASCATPSGNTIIDALVTLPVNTSATFTVTANVPASQTGVLTNTATVTAPTGVSETNQGNNSATVNSGPAPQADLGILKTASPEPYRPGTTVTYTITVSNVGPSNVIGARVQDTFPGPMSGFTWACGGAGGATCGIASGAGVIDALVNIPVGGVITFSASGVVPVSTTTTVTNIASVSVPAATNDTNGANNSSSAVSTPIHADVSITKIDAADPVAAADIIVYTLNVSNAGASPATNVVVSDPVPAGTTFVSASGTGWTCTLTGATIGCTTPSLGLNQTLPITVRLRAPNEPGVVTNTATVSASEVDPNTANNTDAEPTTITPRADLAITKVSTPHPYVPGTPFRYTIVVSNLGPSTALGAEVSDTLPPDLAAFTWTCAPNNSGAACGTASGTGPAVSTLLNLAPGGSVTILVTGTLPSGTTGVLTNTAEVLPPATVPDPVPGNNSSTDINPANVVADLRISKASTPTPYVPGEPLIYTVVVTNAGPSDAPGARVRDPLPPAFAGFTWTCTAGAGAVCTTPSGTGDVDALVDLPVGTTATFTSTGPVASSYGGLATNTATITPPVEVFDPVPGNNTASAQNPPGPVADLAITKAQTPDPYVPGAALTYTLLVTNLGPSDVTHARVLDVLPSVIGGATWTCAASGAGAACASASGVDVVDALVTLPTGTSATFTITGSVLASATGVVSNTATVTPPIDVTDPVPGNNTSTVNSGGAPQADLAIVKTASVDPYVPGQPLSFTIVARNNGPSDAPNARVQDLFPASLSGFTWSCAPSAGAATCGAAGGVSLIDVLVNLPVGGAVTFTVTGTVPPDTTGPLNNTATVTPPIGVNDPQPANNTSAVRLGANALADLSLTKTSSPNPYVPGSPITYTIVATNAGPSTLLGGRVRDGLPAVLQNVTWICDAVNATCPAPSGTGNIDALVDIEPGGTVTFTVQADVPVGTRGTLVNAATIVPPPGTEDPNPPNNTGTNYNPSIPIPGPADLQITQEFPGVAPPNGLLTFRLRSRNLGSNTALNPYMTGMIPPGTTFVSVTPSAGGFCNTPGNPPAPDPVTGYPIPGAATEPLRCTWPGLMKPGESHFMEFTVRVAPGTPTGQILWSCWWTWSETEDPYHANNVVDAYLFVDDGASPVGDLSVHAAALSEGVVGTSLPTRVGVSVPMRFWATNHGPSATRGQYALILDTANTIAIVDADVSQGWATPTGASSAMWDTGLVQPGQTVTFDLTVQLLTPSAVELFAQRVTGSPGDPNASNERATIVLDGYAPGVAGRWVAVGNVDGAGRGEILTGAGQGETPQVRVFTGTGADTGLRFFAYERPFRGGVQIASCDVNGDGTAELITAPGPGRAPTIRVLSLLGGVVTELTSFDAFEPTFTGGASIACADLDADGSAEVIVGAGPGRAPEVHVYSVGLSSITPRATFLAYESGFLGGVRVAAGVYPGRAGWLDAFAILTTPGIGRAAELRLWTPTGAPVAQVVVSTATRGVLPTLGDVNGDGQLDLLLAPDDGRPELVRIFEVDTGTLLGNVEGGLPAFPVGIRTAVGVLEGGPGQPEIVIGNGPGGHPRVRVVFWPASGPIQRLEILPLEIP